MSQVSIAVVGAGLIGRRHAGHVAACPDARLSAIVDPSPAGEEVAAAHGVPLFRDLSALLASARPDGLIIATPNQLHVEHGLEAVAAGLPAIVEKPVADEVAGATRLVEAEEAAGVPLLVGHHRRYNPMVSRAKEVIDSGRLGRILALHGQFWLMKPDDYFAPAWRRSKGAGPVFLNLIHDIDLFRYLCGEIVCVQAQESNAVRGHAVEETAVLLLRFAGGALGTVTVSDSVVAPWSWELTTGENPAYPRQDQSCYLIGGTEGSLTVPQLEVWWNRGPRSWWEPLARERVPYVPADPLQEQVRHFCAVVRGQAQPLVSGREGLRTLQVVEAVKEAARTGATVALG
jgi:predicted dehydrogenase